MLFLELLEPLITSKKLLTSRSVALSQSDGMRLVELVHTTLAMQYDKVDTQLLIKIIQYTATMFWSTLNYPPTQHSFSHVIPNGYFHWGCDVGKSHSQWRNAFEKAKPDNDLYADTFIPPSLLWNERVKVWPDFVPKQNVDELIDMCLLAAKFDLHSNCSSTPAKFQKRQNQGVVLRTGYIFESNPGYHLPNEEVNGQPNPTYNLIKTVRQFLPIANSNTGMILIRITNYPCLSESAVDVTSVTPPHIDDVNYGPHVFSLSLSNTSALIFSAKRDTSYPPISIIPDQIGALTHFTGTLRYNYFHWVPNALGPRISITWRPTTKLDMAEKPFKFKGHTFTGVSKDFLGDV